jgi:hypothetical protein
VVPRSARAKARRIGSWGATSAYLHGLILRDESTELVLVERLAVIVADRHDFRSLTDLVRSDEAKDDVECVVLKVTGIDEMFHRDAELCVFETRRPASEMNGLDILAGQHADLLDGGRIGLAFEHVERDLSTLAGQNELALGLERLKTKNGTSGHGNDLSLVVEHYQYILYHKRK